MKLGAILGAALALTASAALAQTVKVGVTIPLSGPAADLGIGQKNVMALYPDHVGDIKIQYIVLDDASDTTRSVINTKKLISENKVDVIIGSSTSPQCLAMIDPVAEAKTPMIALGSSYHIVQPMDPKRKWVFKVPANDDVWIRGMIKHMLDHGVKTAGFIGFNDAFGQSWYNSFKAISAKNGIKLVDAEFYQPTDTSVTAQVLKLTVAKPDIVLIAASGTPAALPVIALHQRGYRGKVYLNAAAASREFLKTAGKSANGALLTVGLSLVWQQMPDSNPLKSVNAAFVKRYEAKYGKNSMNLFASQGYDAARFLERAIPEAAKVAAPGTPEFRAALRDALENMKDLQANTGVYNMTPEDHSGLDLRAVVMAEIKDGQFKYLPE
jgi:branched-chain amino acid transport system substrate-binding protein